MEEISINDPDIENYGEDELVLLFNTYCNQIKTLDSMSNENKLYLYKYYKQSTIGNINIEEPGGWFNFEAKEKYKAWKSVEDTSKNVSLKKYINKVRDLLNT